MSVLEGSFRNYAAMGSKSTESMQYTVLVL